MPWRRYIRSRPPLYLADHDVDPEGCAIVELEGPLSDDRDLDADSGAVLILPGEVVAVHPARAPRAALNPL